MKEDSSYPGRSIPLKAKRPRHSRGSLQHQRVSSFLSRNIHVRITKIHEKFTLPTSLNDYEYGIGDTQTDTVTPILLTLVFLQDPLCQSQISCKAILASQCLPCR